MLEQKERILEAISRGLANMTDQEKTYLIGFLEGVAAMAGTQSTTERPGV